MEWITETLRNNPSLAIFITIGIGFFIGQLKYKGFSLGTVTSVLLVGVAVGQFDISIPGPIKDAFFLLFLFAIGYSVGPQFFQALKGDGLKQVGFAVVVCVLCLLSTWGVAVVMGYNIGEAVGLMAGTQTMSAVIGVGIDTMKTLGVSDAQVKEWENMIPVCYAVTYVFGTIGTAYLLANLGPVLLGGLKKVKKETEDLEKTMNTGSSNKDPNYINAMRPVTFRAYKAEDAFFSSSPTVSQLEEHLKDQGKRLFVERLRTGGSIVDPDPEMKIAPEAEIVLSGRREYIIGDEKWIGEEINDPELLNFPVEQLDVTVTKKGAAGLTVDQVRSQKTMYGVAIKSIMRSGTSIPVLAQTKLQAGDYVTVVGLEKEVSVAAPVLGIPNKKSAATNMVMLGIGLFLGGLLGVLAIHIGSVPISLSTSGGALVGGLVCGWLHSKKPSIGGIPQSSVWLLTNLGLNMFIAVVGISSGPSFVSGLKEVGFILFFMGVIATSLPLILSMYIGKYIFKFPAAINLGCCSGARTSTASLGAIQEAIHSDIPAMGYTVCYAIGNMLLILWGVVIVLLMH